MKFSLIHVGIEVPGAHYYPESTRPYLKALHRHDFKISAVISVTDPNRQFEFYDVQDVLRETLDKLYVKADKSTYNFGTRSCEHIANELMEALKDVYPLNSVSVFEDEYNGSVVVQEASSTQNEIYKGEKGKGLIVPPKDYSGGGFVSDSFKLTERNNTAEEIVTWLLSDFTDRRGFRQQWDLTDSDIQDEIRNTWKEIIVKVLEGRKKMI